MNKMREVEQYIRNRAPDLQVLKFGCDVIHKPTSQQCTFMSFGRNRNTAHVMPVSGKTFLARIDDLEIIGQWIQFWDVRRVVNSIEGASVTAHAIPGNGAFGEITYGTRHAQYVLSASYYKQRPEVYTLLYDILSPRPDASPPA